MLSFLFAACLLQQATPDTSLRLLPGDQWTSEVSYQFEGEWIDLINVESTHYAVAKEGHRTTLTARWKLLHSKIDGELAPAPKGIEPIVLKVSVDGDSLTPRINEDVARHRIERAIQIERKGVLSEPTYFPPPPNVRMVGFEKTVRRAPQTPGGFNVSAWETAGEWPMKVTGQYNLDPTSGILISGRWVLDNSPIPGGEALCRLTITLKVRDLKLVPRR